MLMKTVLVSVLTAASAVVVTVQPGAARPLEAKAFDVTVTGAGRPVILIPGLSTTGAMWNPTVEHLRPSYEVHVLTIAGFGGPAPIGEPFLPRVIEAVVAYAQALDARPVIVGHSLGGFMAFAAASRAPDAFAGVLAVDGVPFLGALSNQEATAASLEDRAAQVKAMYATMSREQFAVQTRMALAGMITSPADVERAVAWTAATDPAAAGIAVAEMMTTDLRDEVRRITVPVRLIGALGAVPETIRPTVRQAYRAQLDGVPDASVVFADRARHFVMLDDPASFFAALDGILEEAAWTP